MATNSYLNSYLCAYVNKTKWLSVNIVKFDISFGLQKWLHKCYNDYLATVAFDWTALA